MKGTKVRTLKPGRTQVNIIRTRKREHSRKPDELYKIIEKCSWGPFLELFARGKRKGWTSWEIKARNIEFLGILIKIIANQKKLKLRML